MSLRPHSLCRTGKLALALAVAAIAHGAETPPEGWFEWPMVEPVEGSALDLNRLNRPGVKLGRISVRDGRFVNAVGQPLRFWGANLSANECFPPSAEEAATISRRLAKGGVNIARLHHLDNPWAISSGGSLWPADRPDRRELDSDQLDKLHRLIAALRDQGIYSNLNLKVSKSLGPADGFDATIAQLHQFQKRVDIFDPRMIELQKDYARRLLTTRNPYTGFAPAEDPAIAVIELNNENSLLGFWTRDLGRGLDKLPEPFRRDLQAQWNTWLARRYADDRDLARAWAPPEQADRSSLLEPNAEWVTNLDRSSAASFETDAEQATHHLRVTATSGIAHHVQISTFGLPIADGEVYTVSFEAKAEAPRKLGVGVSADNHANPGEPWRSLGLLETVDIGTNWTPVRLSFPAHSAAGGKGQLSFSAGQSTGEVSIRRLQLVRGAPGAGLHAGQSPARGTVPIPTTPSARQWADWIAFLAETERAFAEEMRAFLRDELHVQAPIVCSQIDYGGLTGMHREQSMEFTDAHAYWQHPDFIGADWSAENWVIRNSPQLAVLGDRQFGELGNLALVRVAGKPFTVSEYDHPAPSDFACEMYPTVASFAARQDWNIVYPFSISAYGSANPDGRIRDFFDQMDHPAKWGQTVFAALTFRRGDVPRAPLAATLHLGSPVWAEQPHADVLWRQLINRPLDFLNVRYQVSERPGTDDAKARVEWSGASLAAPPPVRIISAPQGKVYLINTDRAAAAVGFLGGGSADAGPLRIQCERFGRDFASVTAVALDDKPLRQSGRVLVTVVARGANRGMIWNEARTSLGANWGKGPTIAERVPATIALAGVAGRRVYALAPDGSRARSVETVGRGGQLTFAVAAEHQSLHYEIVAQPE